MRKLRTRLNVLGLENRLTPAASVSFSSGSLTVTGDNTSNTVVFDGANNAMKVYVVSGQNLFGAYQGGAAATLAAIEANPSNYRGTYNLTGSVTARMGNSN